MADSKEIKVTYSLLMQMDMHGITGESGDDITFRFFREARDTFSRVYQTLFMALPDHEIVVRKSASGSQRYNVILRTGGDVETGLVDIMTTFNNLRIIYYKPGMDKIIVENHYIYAPDNVKNWELIDWNLLFDILEGIKIKKAKGKNAIKS